MIESYYSRTFRPRVTVDERERGEESVKLFFLKLNAVTADITPPLSSALATEGGGEVAEGYRSPLHITQLQTVCTANITMSMELTVSLIIFGKHTV